MPTRSSNGSEIAESKGSTIWREFRVTSQPAFVFINNDGTVESRIGAMGLEGLTARINELIAA
jgi:hypothetical protein